MTKLPPLFLTGFVVIILLCHWRWGWVPILDSANLAFHEAGHPLFGMLAERLGVYGGTIMQLLIPAACTFECYRHRQHLGFFFCLVWIAENLLNIARYMADARAHLLPLVGGLDPEEFHDWTQIFGRWGLLRADTKIALFVRLLAVGLMVYTTFMTWRKTKDSE